MISRGETNFPRGAITPLIVFLFYSSLFLLHVDGHPTRWTTRARKGGRREEILRSERNGVPVMGSPGISLKCRGLSIIRGQPLLHRASRSAGDEVRKERKGGGVRWKRTQACTRRNEHARPPLLLLFLSFLAFLSLWFREQLVQRKKSRPWKYVISRATRYRVRS